MMNGLRCLACALLFFIGGIAEAADFSGKVLAVLDGDTLLVLRNCEGVEPKAPGTLRRPPCGDNRPAKVRLAEIDAPEKAQPYGTASQESLVELVMGKQIKAAVRAADDYGRLVATVHADGFNVNHEQVRRGMAWEYSRFHSNRGLMALQHEAQQAKRGLWADEEAVEPSHWRKQHPASAQSHAGVLQVAATAPGIACGSKKYCSEMASCEEARHYLTQCGIKTLDGNNDGVPCEKLCSPKESKAD